MQPFLEGSEGVVCSSVQIATGWGSSGRVGLRDWGGYGGSRDTVLRLVGLSRYSDQSRSPPANCLSTSRMARPVDDCRQLCGVSGCWCQSDRAGEKTHNGWIHWQQGAQCCICARRFHSGSDRIACGEASGKCPTDCYICLSVDQKGVRRYDKQADHHDVCNCCGGFTRARFLRASCQREGLTPFAGWALITNEPGLK